MGSDIQRALLWILFGLSAFMLYDRWEVYNGRPSFFGAETQQVATTEAPKNEAALPSQSQTASLPAEAKTAVKAEPIQVETDLLKLSFYGTKRKNLFSADRFNRRSLPDS